MTPTDSLGKYISGLRASKPAWAAYFAPTGWVRNGLPDLNQQRPQLTIDGGVFTSVEPSKAGYVEQFFVVVSLWFPQAAGKADVEKANEISADIAATLHEAVTDEDIRIEVSGGRDFLTDVESGLGRVRISLRLMELS